MYSLVNWQAGYPNVIVLDNAGCIGKPLNKQCQEGVTAWNKLKEEGLLAEHKCFEAKTQEGEDSSIPMYCVGLWKKASLDKNKHMHQKDLLA